MRFLGAITAASGTYNNWQTGVSGIGAFVIPKGVRSLYLQAGSSGIFFEIGSSGIATDQTRGAQLPFSRAAGAIGTVPQSPQGPFRTPDVDGGTVVSIHNSVGGFVSVRIYGSNGRG